MEAGSVEVKPLSADAIEVQVKDSHSLLKCALNDLDEIDCAYIAEISPGLEKESVSFLRIKSTEELTSIEGKQSFVLAWRPFEEQLVLF